MATKGAVSKAWTTAVKAEARARSLRSGVGWVADVRGAMLVAGSTLIADGKDTDGRRPAVLSVRAKPMSLDPLLWRTLFPDGEMGGPAQQLTLRVNGAFTVTGVLLGSGSWPVDDGIDLSPATGAALDLLQGHADTFAAEVPDEAAYVDAVRRARAERPDRPVMLRDTLALALAAAGDLEGLSVVIDEALLAGDRTFSNRDTTLWDLLRRDLDAGTGIFAGA